MSLSNYRLISILPTFRQIFEKLFFRLRLFLKKFNILSKAQFDFTELKSSSEAINEFIEFSVSNLDADKDIQAFGCFGYKNINGHTLFLLKGQTEKSYSVFILLLLFILRSTIFILYYKNK